MLNKHAKMLMANQNSVISNGLICYVDAANLLSYSGSGSILYDLSGNGNNLVLHNTPVFNSAGYFKFDGINQYIKSANALNLRDTQAVTVIINMRFNEYGTNSVMIAELSKRAPDNDSSFFFAACIDEDGRSDELQLCVSGNAGINADLWSKALVNDLIWHNMAAVFDKSLTGKESKLYTDGQFSASLNQTTFSNNNTNNYEYHYMYFMARNEVKYFANAFVSSILIYNRALTADEILVNYNYTKVFNQRTGLLRHYPFTGNANDESGNEQNGTVSGATLTTDRFGNTNKAYNFNGTSHYITASLLHIDTFSISLWFYCNEDNRFQSILEFTNGVGKPRSIRITTENLMAIYYGNKNVKSIIGFTPKNSQWNHIYAWHNEADGTTLVYINNNLMSLNAENTSSLSFAYDNFVIGKSVDSDAFFNGNIDDIRIYNYRLSTDEITALYAEH